MLSNVVIVGASLAGLRAAETLRADGFAGRITLIGAESHLPYDRPPLSKKLLAGALEPERIHLRKEHEYTDLDHGVDLRLELGVEAIEGTSRVERVRFTDGLSVEADVVVVGVGVAPATGWLAGSGLELRDGVVCDATLAAGPPGVFAAGDLV